MPRPDGEMLRAWRLSKHWAVPEMARQIRRAAGEVHIAAPDALKTMINKWERDAVEISERYMLLYCKVLGVSPERLGSGPGHESSKDLYVAKDTRLRWPIDELDFTQLEELIGLLDEQCMRWCGLTTC